MKTGKVLGVLAMSAMLLTGCVDSMPDLTAEQSEMVAEYAAGLLLKYSRNYDYKIASAEEVAEARAAMEPSSENEEESSTQNSEEVPEEEETITETSSEEQLPEVEILVGSADTDFAAEVGIDDVILRYQSFELCDTYPQESTGFNVSAAQNKQLLVVHFDLSASPEEDIACSLFEYGLKAEFVINDSISVRALSTMLPNELIFYMDTIAAGDIVDVVIVAEVEGITQADIETLTMQLSSNTGKCIAKLK